MYGDNPNRGFAQFFKASEQELRFGDQGWQENCVRIVLRCYVDSGKVCIGLWGQS